MKIYPYLCIEIKTKSNMGIDKELKGQMIKEIKRRVIKILGAFTIIFILYLVVMLNWIKTLETEQVKEKSEKIVEIIAE